MHVFVPASSTDIRTAAHLAMNEQIFIFFARLRSHGYLKLDICVVGTFVETFGLLHFPIKL